MFFSLLDPEICHEVDSRMESEINHEIEPETNVLYLKLSSEFVSTKESLRFLVAYVDFFTL